VRECEIIQGNGGSVDLELSGLVHRAGDAMAVWFVKELFGGDATVMTGGVVSRATLTGQRARSYCRPHPRPWREDTDAFRQEDVGEAEAALGRRRRGPDRDGAGLAGLLDREVTIEPASAVPFTVTTGVGEGVEAAR